MFVSIEEITSEIETLKRNIDIKYEILEVVGAECEKTEDELGELKKAIAECTAAGVGQYLVKSAQERVKYLETAKELFENDIRAIGFEIVSMEEELTKKLKMLKSQQTLLEKILLEVKRARTTYDPEYRAEEEEEENEEDGLIILVE